MAKPHISPGSYFIEEDKVTQNVDNSQVRLAILGASKKGPVNQRVLTTSWDEFTFWFGYPDPSYSKMHYAAYYYFVGGGKRLYTTRIINDDPQRGDVPLTAGCTCTVDDPDSDAPLFRLNVYDSSSTSTQFNAGITGKGIYDPMNTWEWNPQEPGIESILFTLFAIDPGPWNDTIYVEMRPNQKRGTPDVVSGTDDPYTFYIDVFLNYTSPKQQPVESFLVTRNQEVDGYGKNLFIEQVINRQSKYIRVINNPLAKQYKIYHTAKCFFSGGTAGSHFNLTQFKKALDLYRDFDEVRINKMVEAGPHYGITDPYDIATYQRYMNEIAKERGDISIYIDVPVGYQYYTQASYYKHNILNLKTSYLSLHTSDVLVQDNYNQTNVWIPLSSVKIGQLARMGFGQNLGKEVSGRNRGDLTNIILKSRYDYNQPMRDHLDEYSINFVKPFIDDTTITNITKNYILYNNKTLLNRLGESPLEFEAVRDLVNNIETTLCITNRLAIQEPNDKNLWVKLWDSADTCLKNALGVGALRSYEHYCDENTNTADIVAAQQVYMIVYIQPVICIRRIMINMNLYRTGSSLNPASIQTTINYV